MTFDVKGARAAGYSDSEIASHLAQDKGFDIAGARKSGYSDSEIIGHLAGEARAVDKIAPPEPTLTEKITALPGQIKEAVTGTRRTTPEVQDALDAGRTLYDMPESNELSLGVVKAALGGLFAGSKERAQIFANSFPGVTVREDEQGNQWLKSAKDGQEYIIPPGFKATDVPRTVAAVAAFTPAGRATTIGGAALGAAAAQAAIEGTQAAAGGDFNSGDVAAAGLLGGAVPAVAMGARALAPAAKQILQRARGAPSPVAAIEPAAVAEPATVAAMAEPVAPAAPAPSMFGDQMAQTARKAAEGGMGSKAATQALAEQAAPNLKVVEAAKRLGIEEYLQPDHVTSNQAYREIAQAVKSIPGSEARAAELSGLESVAKRADDLIEEIGGTHDASTLSVDVKKNLQATHEDLKTKAGKLYDEVRANVPAKADAPADNVLSLIKARVDELGGEKNLSSMEKIILAKLSPKKVNQIEIVPGNNLMPGAQTASKQTVQNTRQPTYALLDDVRRDLTAARYSRQGPFKDSDDRLITMLEGALRTDQQKVAQSYGMGEVWDLAQKTSASYKAIQDDLIALFGKNLDQSIVGPLDGSVKLLSKGDTSRFIRLIQSVPEGMRQQVVASGLNTAFGRSARNQNVSFNSYAKWYEGLLKNKQAYTAVMANLPPQARKQLSDLYRVSSSISAATKERITTGRINAIKDELKPADTLATRLYDTARQSAVGATVGTAVGAVAGPGVGAAVASALAKGAKPEAIKAVDKLISSPEFIELAKKAGTPEQRRATLRLVHSANWKRFAKAANQPHDPSSAEKWVSQALQTNNQRGNN